MLYNIDVSFEPFIFFGGGGDWVIFLEMHMYIGPLLETNQLSWGRITWQKYNTHHLFFCTLIGPLSCHRIVTN